MAFDALCLMYVMVSPMVSISYGSCCVFNQVGIRSSLIIFVWHIFLVDSWSSIFFLHLYVQFDVAHNQSVFTSKVDLVDDYYVCRDVWPVFFRM